MPSRKYEPKPVSVRRPPPARKRGPNGPGPRGPVKSWIFGSAAATRRFGARLAQLLRGGEVVALMGDLGAGKTQFVKGLAEGLGARSASVASPTFVLIHEYSGRVPLAHVDLYRLESVEELDQLGWSDYLDGRWVVAVEWAEKAGSRLPPDRVEIRLQHRSPTTRVATCTPVGPVAEAMVRGLRPRSGRLDTSRSASRGRPALRRRRS